MSGCSHRPVVAPLVAVPHVLQSALRFPHPCLQPPALLYSFPINQSIARLLFYRWPFLIFGRLFLYPACRFGNLFSLFSFFVVFGYHSITSVLQSTSAVSHWWSDWTHPDQPVWGCLNSVLAVLLHHLELIQLSKKTNLYMLNI